MRNIELIVSFFYRIRYVRDWQLCFPRFHNSKYTYVHFNLTVSGYTPRLGSYCQHQQEVCEGEIGVLNVFGVSEKWVLFLQFFQKHWILLMFPEKWVIFRQFFQKQQVYLCFPKKWKCKQDVNYLQVSTCFPRSTSFF